jgi:hypothetical protein
VWSAAMIIQEASETAPDFYANRCWQSGLKTPDRAARRKLTPS